MSRLARFGGVEDTFRVVNLSARVENFERKVVLVLLSDVLVEEQGGDTWPNDGSANSPSFYDINECLFAEVSSACR